MRFFNLLSVLTGAGLLGIQMANAQISSPSLVQTEVIEIPGQTSDNQIYSLNYTQKLTTREYYDGLGRLIQKNDVQGSPALKDIIQISAFNNLNQSLVSYLPYVSSDGTGNFHTSANSEQTTFYSNGLSDKVVDDSSPFKQQIAENSPLQRIINEGMNGLGFQPTGGHYKSINYRSNNSISYSNDGLNSGVRIWNFDGTSLNTYPSFSLDVVEFTDEAGNLTITYKDHLGRIVLKRQIINSQIIDGFTENCLDTYYVYDDANELRMVIPPKALTLIRNAGGSPWNITATGAAILIFQLNYDSYGRLIEKKVPSAGWIYIVYDPKNRPVLVQNGNLGAGTTKKWIYAKYDNKNRVTSTGIYSDNVNGSSRTSMQSYVNSINYGTYWCEEKQTGGTVPNYYTNRIFPTQNQDGSALNDLVYNYYDDYDFNGDGANDYNYLIQGLTNEALQTAFNRGILTGVFTKTFNNDATLAVWLHKVSIYDKKGNLIQVISNNHTNTAATDTKTNVPDFSNKTTITKIVKTVNSVSTSIVDNFSYDYLCRLTDISQSNNGGANVYIAKYIYNELGQLVNKKLHSTDQVTYGQNIDYRYNINQKLTSINNSTLSIDNTGYTNSDAGDLFGEEILYDKVDGNISNTAIFNGNISAVKWEAASSSNNLQRCFKYSYDQLNRLTSANYLDRPYSNTGAWGNSGMNDEKNIQYDLEGNVEKLQRYYNNSTTPIDNLTYSYTSVSGNQLANVSDAGTTAGFNSAASSNPYVYDTNGNLITDPKRGTAGTQIAYNIINLTDKILFTGSANYIRYTYDGSGAVLRKEIYNGSTTTTLDYIDGFVYQNMTLAYFSTPEGRVRNSSGTLTFEYFIRDHLGNVRVSFDGSSSPTVRQENSYYPFGMTMYQNYSASPPNNNLYNGGSELQNDLGNLPDFYQTDFRNYDAVLGKFTAVDPLSENYTELSPYQFSLNNPISNNDPTGALDDEQNAIDQLMSGADGGVMMMDQAHSDYYSGKSDALGGPVYSNSLVQAVATWNAKIPTTENVAEFWSVTWSIHAADIFVTETEGGFNLNYTATSTMMSYNDLFESFATMYNHLNKEAMTSQQSADFDNAANVTSFMTLMTQVSKYATGVQAAQAYTNAEKISYLGAGQLAKTSGQALGLFSALYTGYSGYQEHGMSWGLVAKVGIGLITTFTPFGWTYAALDLGVGMITGKGLTDRIGDKIDGR